MGIIVLCSKIGETHPSTPLLCNTSYIIYFFIHPILLFLSNTNVSANTSYVGTNDLLDAHVLLLRFSFQVQEPKYLLLRAWVFSPRGLSITFRWRVLLAGGLQSHSDAQVSVRAINDYNSKNSIASLPREQCLLYYFNGPNPMGLGFSLFGRFRSH